MAREVVILSGKGGTGKTTVASSLAKLFAPAIIADADVDAADMFIMLEPEQQESTPFFGLGAAKIDQEICSRCGACLPVCRFDAIVQEPRSAATGVLNRGGTYRVVEHHCEGCTLCSLICPAGAISMTPRQVGQWFRSETAFGPMVHARLRPGAENSGKLVTAVRAEAARLAEETGEPLIVTDGPPGIGCPVTAAITGADLAVLVTEPTLSGVHDLARVADLAVHFGVAAAVVVNKADLDRQRRAQIESVAAERGLPVIGEIPFSREVMEAQMRKLTAVDMPDRHPVHEAMLDIHRRLVAMIDEGDRAQAT